MSPADAAPVPLPACVPKTNHRPSSPQHEKASGRWLWRLALVSIVYFVSGRLGLMLAVPPGYATAVFPAAGIALAAVMIWGRPIVPAIWLGSFLMNASMTAPLPSEPGAIAAALVLPALIAMGGSLQALTGAFLIRRSVGYRNLLEQELEVLSILLVGGPLACVIGATVGVGSLWWRGVIPGQNVIFNWWTWWVGDSIGVLIFAPIVLVLTVRTGERLARKKMLATVPLVCMFVLVVTLFVHVSRQEAERVSSEFDGWGDDFATSLANDIDQYEEALQATAGLFAVDGAVSRSAYVDFARRLLEHSAGLQALNWAPVINAAQRKSFETSMRAQGFSDYRIVERDGQGRSVDARSRDVYVPVAYSEPQPRNAQAIGYDLASETRRAAMLIKSRASRRPVASAPLRLVQEPADRQGLLIALPVFASSIAEAPGQMPRGYVVAVLRVPDLMRPALQRIELAGVAVRIFDVTDDVPALIYGDAGFEPDRDSLGRTLEQPIAGRRWRLELTLPAQFLVAHRSLQAWTVLAAGLLFVGLLGIFLLVVIGRTARIEALVSHRTRELTLVNHSLAAEAERRTLLENEARLHTERLAASNAELEQFAYIASHDLQAPLRSVASFAGLIERRYRGRLDGDADKFLTAIRNSVTEMRSLIDDLLQLSRVTDDRVHAQPVSLADVLDWTRRQLAADIEESHATIDTDELPMVMGDMRMLRQLFQNLLGNALRFRISGQRPALRIGAERLVGQWRISIEDNGIGIPVDRLEDVFRMFKRLNGHEYPGTGMGLAICRKVVQLHGGRIWAESGFEHPGTRFVFTLRAGD